MNHELIADQIRARALRVLYDGPPRDVVAQRERELDLQKELWREQLKQMRELMTAAERERDCWFSRWRLSDRRNARLAWVCSFTTMASVFFALLWWLGR